MNLIHNRYRYKIVQFFLFVHSFVVGHRNKRHSPPRVMIVEVIIGHGHISEGSKTSCELDSSRSSNTERMGFLSSNSKRLNDRTSTVSQYVYSCYLIGSVQRCLF